MCGKSSAIYSGNLHSVYWSTEVEELLRVPEIPDVADLRNCFSTE